MNKEPNYLFATNINGKNLNGIIDVSTLEVMCYCTEEQSKTLIKALTTTTPPQTMSAEEIIDKYFKYNEFDKKRVIYAMEEYRNQPIKFIPPHSAEQEADSMVNNYKEHDYEYAVLLSIANIDYAIYQLKSANVSTVWHEEVLTILKGM